MRTEQHRVSVNEYVLESAHFRPEPESVGLARNWVAGHYEARRLPTEVVRLLVSEVVTNAVTHAGGGPITVRLLGSLAIEVCDVSPVLPVRRVAGDDDTDGRGLALVEALAERFEIRPEGAGKCVRFFPAQGETA